MDLSIDYQELRTASEAARQVSGMFQGVRPVTPETAALTGHAGLAAAVMTFSEAWDAVRSRILQDLEFIGDGLRLIADRLESVDLGLAGRRAPGAGSSQAPRSVVPDDGR